MRNKRKIIYLCLLISWMLVIFFMSNQPAEISNSQSALVIRLLALAGIDINSTFGELANFIVRKSAHFTEYMILAYLALNVFECYNVKKKRLIVFTVMFVFIYASSDEIHQNFVPGRECAFRDVLIDTSGGIAGCLIISFLRKVFRNIKFFSRKVNS